MDDAKRAYREAENKTKEAIRKSDGDESLSDKVGNLGDDIRQGLGNAGDDIRTEADRASLESMDTAFAKGNSVKDLLVGLVGTRSFRYRTPGAGEKLQ